MALIIGRLGCVAVAAAEVGDARQQQGAAEPFLGWYRCETGGKAGGGLAGMTVRLLALVGAATSRSPQPRSAMPGTRVGRQALGLVSL